MSEKTLDVEEFLDRVQGDKELLFELLDIFITDFQPKREALKEAIENKDHATVEHVSHFLKGSCGNISAGPLRAIFHDLEKRGKNKDLEGLDGYLDVIDQRFEELVTSITEARTNLQ